MAGKPPPFDPKKPFTEVGGSAASPPPFDPKKPFEAVAENPRQPLPAGESAIAGATQGATLGFGDELYGAFRGGIKALARKGPFSDNYEKYRNQNREYNKQAAADNPKSYIGGNLAGGVAVSSLLPVAAGAGIVKTGLHAAALGGVAGLGASEGNLSTPEKTSELASDVGQGVLIGGALGAAGKAVSKGIDSLKPSNLNAYANKRALSAAGFMTKDMKKLSPEQQQQIGQQLRDSKIVTAFSSLDDVAERSAAAKESSGQAIGKAIDTIDDHVKGLISGIDSGKILQGASDQQKAVAKKYVSDNFQFNMQKVGERIRSELVEPNSDNPLIKNELARLTGLADDFSSKGAKSLSFGNYIKSTQGKQTRFQSETIPEEFKQDVYRILKEEIENTVAKTGNLEGGIAALTGNGTSLGNVAARNKQALGDYEGAKKLYGAATSAEKAATDSLGRTNANRTFGLTDYLAGLGGMGMTGEPVTGITLGVLNKAARKYGASTQMAAAGKLADTIKAVQGVTTDKLAEAIGGAISKTPAVAQKYGNVIANAATRGKSSLVAVHMSLLKDPEYATAVGAIEESPMQRRLKQVQGGQ